MRTQRTTRRLLSVALCTLVLGSSAWAGGGFFDDFSDGSIQDGSPVTWVINPSDDGVGTLGKCQVTAEGLEFTPDWPTHKTEAMGRYAFDAYGRLVHYTGRLTIRTQVKMGETTTTYGPSVFIWFRGMEGNGYEVIINKEWLFFGRFNAGVWYSPMDTWHYRTKGSFDPKEEFVLQVDVIDLTDSAGNRTTSRLEARYWVAGQEMPVQPQLAVHDATFEAGEVAIGVSCDSELNRTVIFRWVEVIGTEVEVEPIVDFNGDGTVGSSDLLRLIESWGQADPAVDLVRDGVVDQQDLEVLMDVNDPTLVAHWALDETEGTIAHDGVGLTPGTVLGDAVWRPDGGQRKGALEFDGVDDVITAGAVVNPSKGPFSVLAWVKGGAPGQVIFSQTSGANWLMADASQGLLKTELRSTGRFAKPLCSQTTITDGDWHRVALVCDGSNRILYVDDVAAAQDVQTNLTEASGNLLIGAGSTLAPGTFWSGLIDDVRIYNRAVKP
jgi:hypothetical protein